MRLLLLGEDDAAPFKGGVKPVARADAELFAECPREDDFAFFRNNYLHDESILRLWLSRQFGFSFIFSFEEPALRIRLMKPRSR